jgi:uncharacterized protein YccT (UPF0319 family)
VTTPTLQNLKAAYQLADDETKAAFRQWINSPIAPLHATRLTLTEIQHIYELADDDTRPALRQWISAYVGRNAAPPRSGVSWNGAERSAMRHL